MQRCEPLIIEEKIGASVNESAQNILQAITMQTNNPTKAQRRKL